MEFVHGATEWDNSNEIAGPGRKSNVISEILSECRLKLQKNIINNLPDMELSRLTSSCVY